ncbi:MAG: phosphoribosylanthranilate isomerase [Devosia sp.]
MRLDGWPPRQPSPLVKICGISSVEMALAAVGAGADMIGVVHFPPSPRHVSIEEAAVVAEAVRGKAMIVALTVNADDATLDAFVAAVRPDALQLHGKETPERVAALASWFGRPVAKALGVSEASDLEAAKDYDGLLVIDAKPPKGADRPGGHGQPFDWSLLAELPEGQPYMLSGGLNAKSVEAAIAALSPYAVDVSTGVETDGRKDAAKITAFVAAAKAAATATA